MVETVHHSFAIIYIETPVLTRAEIVFLRVLIYLSSLIFPHRKGFRTDKLLHHTKGETLLCQKYFFIVFKKKIEIFFRYIQCWVLGSITYKLEGKPHKLHHTFISIYVFTVDKKKIIIFTFFHINYFSFKPKRRSPLLTARSGDLKSHER